MTLCLKTVDISPFLPIANKISGLQTPQKGRIGKTQLLDYKFALFGSPIGNNINHLVVNQIPGVL